MDIKLLKVGELRTNCYIIKDKDYAIVIDPGFEIERILEEIGKLKVKAIILTHGHYDHVTEAFLLKEKTGADVMISQKDNAMMAYSNQGNPDRFLKEGDKVEDFVVIETPGHSQGGICLYNAKEKLLFTGDTLFAGDHGRCDLPGSSPRDMVNSLNKLFKLPPDTMVYPGHGRASTISNELSSLKF